MLNFKDLGVNNNGLYSSLACTATKLIYLQTSRPNMLNSHTEGPKLADVQYMYQRLRGLVEDALGETSKFVVTCCSQNATALKNFIYLFLYKLAAAGC